MQDSGDGSSSAEYTKMVNALRKLNKGRPFGKIEDADYKNIVRKMEKKFLKPCDKGDGCAARNHIYCKHWDKLSRYKRELEEALEEKHNDLKLRHLNDYLHRKTNAVVKVPKKTCTVFTKDPEGDPSDSD